MAPGWNTCLNADTTNQDNSSTSEEIKKKKKWFQIFKRKSKSKDDLYKVDSPKHIIENQRTRIAQLQRENTDLKQQIEWMQSRLTGPPPLPLLDRVVVPRVATSESGWSTHDTPRFPGSPNYTSPFVTPTRPSSLHFTAYWGNHPPPHPNPSIPPPRPHRNDTVSLPTPCALIEHSTPNCMISPPKPLPIRGPAVYRQPIKSIKTDASTPESETCPDDINTSQGEYSITANPPPPPPPPIVTKRKDENECSKQVKPEKTSRVLQDVSNKSIKEASLDSQKHRTNRDLIHSCSIVAAYSSSPKRHSEIGQRTPIN